MVSPELLRRYPIFGILNDEHLKKIAMISEEDSFEKGAVLFEESTLANYFYLLQAGEIDLYYKSEEEFHPKSKKEFLVGEINPGEVFAISALIEPYKHTATARASKESKVIKVNGILLRKMVEEDYSLGFFLTRQVAKMALERLSYARAQLAAAWS